MQQPAAAIAWPVKTREIHNHHMDSTVWNDFKFRDDDIVIATYAKSGTTWTQQIVSQLLFGGTEGHSISELSPWIDLRIPPREFKFAALDAQAHRRFVKTHLPVDALVFSPKAKYIYIGRDGRDVIWSLYNHHINANAKWYGAINDTPGRVGPPIAPPGKPVEDYFADWLEKDGYPFWSYWENVSSWWKIRELPNVKLIHFNDLKADLSGQINGIADFLSVELDPANLERVTSHCTFGYMKTHAAEAAPLGGAMWQGGGETFINKGTNDRWRKTLPEALSAAYEARAVKELGPDCARWLRNGALQQATA